MRDEPFDRCDNCGEPANAGDDRAWYVARYTGLESDSLHIRGVLCDECSHEVGHGLEEVER